jgi:hypothetical protein
MIRREATVRSSVILLHAPATAGKPTPQQKRWLLRGVDQPGGKLPLFDAQGQQISERTVRSCIDKGWAKPWFTNPAKPDWLVCKLTSAGRAVLGRLG